MKKEDLGIRGLETPNLLHKNMNQQRGNIQRLGILTKKNTNKVYTRAKGKYSETGILTKKYFM